MPMALWGQPFGPLGLGWYERQRCERLRRITKGKVPAGAAGQPFGSAAGTASDGMSAIGVNGCAE